MKKFKYPLQVFKKDQNLQKKYPAFGFYPDKWECTFFGHTCKKYGVRAALTFEQLCKNIAVPQRIPTFWDSKDPEDRKWEKACQKCFAPVVYKDNRRLKEKVEYLTMMVWDIDSGKTSYDDVLGFLTQHDFVFIMHTSYSHTPEHHKFRVIFPLVKPIPTAYHEGMELVATQIFVRQFDDFPDCQAIGNKNCTYNCAYLTPHYRADWNEGKEGSKMLDIFDKVQEEFEKIQRRKSIDKLNNAFNSTYNRSAHICHFDDRTMRVASLNADIGAREKFALFLGARKRGAYWEKWTCPSCGKRDATSFHEKHGRAFCNHKNKCGSSWLLPELASITGWNG